MKHYFFWGLISALFVLCAPAHGQKVEPPFNSSGGSGGGAIACVGNPGNTTGAYLSQCQTSGATPVLYLCKNSSGCTVAADWYSAAGSGFSPSGTQAAGTVIQATSGSAYQWISTPTLGIAGTTTGTLGLNNASNAFTFTLGAAAAMSASNTLVGPISVPVNGDLLNCATTSTTCTLTDAGFLASNVVRKDAANTGAAAMTLDLSAASVTAGLKLPSAAGAAPTADGFIAINTTTHALVNGSNGTTIVEAAAATGTNTSTTCTNQVVTVISAVAAPTCSSITTTFLPVITIALGGTNATSAVAGAVPNTSSTTASTWTITPTFGVAGTSTGTLTLANATGSGTFTVGASPSTTTNTMLGPTSVPTTGHLLGCTTSSTTCTLTDSGVVAANVVNASSPGVGVAHFAGSTQTVTSSLIVNADITNSTISLTAKVTGVLPSANGGTGVNNTATLTLGTSNQNWATLGTGIVKNTTTTGAISDAASADVITLWTGTCSSSTYLRGDGACATPTGSGTVTVVGAGSLTSTAIVTGGGSQTVQTPNTSATMDSSGNIVTPGGITTGSGGSVAGYYQFGQGTSTSAGTTAVLIEAPTSVTSYNMVLPGNVPATGSLLECVTSSTVCTVTPLTLGSGVGTWLATPSGANLTSALTTPLTAGGGGTGIANTATLTLGTSNQNWASLGTGIVKNTTTTGAISDAASSDVIGLWTGTCSSSTYLRGDGACQSPSGSGTVTSIATTSPITGGTITSTGTIACATCVTSAASLTAGGIMYGGGSQASVATSAGTTKQIVLSGGTGAPTFIDFPERFMVPAANCNNTTAGAGWSIGSGGTVTCRAGTNNLGGFVAITDTSSTFAQFQVSIPTDWDSSTRPYILVGFESATDTTNGHTVIPEVAVSCATATNGTATDDVTLSAYQSLTTVTFGGSAVAHGFYTTSAQFGSTQMSGCIAGGFMIVSVGRATDSATGVIGFYYADITFPRLLAVQAN